MANNEMNMLVNISVMEASTNKEVLSTIKSNLISAENAAFKVATRCAWLLGVGIPAYDSKIVNKKALKPREVYTAVNKSKATLSRWIKALKYIIDNGLFNDFNAGKYPFSFDKIIMIFDNELVTDDRDFDTLMNMTVTSIESLYKGNDNDGDDADDATDETTNDADDATDDGETVEFSFDGKTFTVNKSIFIDFISNHCEMK